MNPAIEYRVMWNERVQCWADQPGPWVLAGSLKGSFVGYVCDLPNQHEGDHVDSHAGHSWPRSVSELANV